jgi:2,5-diketo-D-gluconate reductase B
MRITPSGIPQMGLGTYGRTGDEGLAAMLAAIELGYRHIDTAQSYGTESTVGRAIPKSGLKRDEFFITTKVADTNLDKASFLPSVEQSLATLQLDYVDLLLIHWPSSGNAVPFEDYMTALAEAKARGWAKRIGVSNYPIADLERAKAVLGEGALSNNQVEIHPYLQSPKLTTYAKTTGLQLTAYQPLAKGRVSGEPVLQAIAEKHGVTAPAISLAFLMGQGYVVIPSSANAGRLAENLAALDVKLADDEIATIKTLNSGARIVNPQKSPKWDD